VSARALNVVFYASDKPREAMLAAALGEGVRAFGDAFEVRRTADYGDDQLYEGPSQGTQVACVFGVKGKSRQIMRDHRDMHRATVYLDKGYTRTKGESGHTEYSRVAVNAADPLAYFQSFRRRSDRWDRLGIQMRPRKANGGHVLFCASTQKYHDFHDLGDAREYAAKVLFRIRKQSDRLIVYRPKPSDNAKPLAGYAFSSGSTSIVEALRGCHCLVTHGSSAAIDALFAGVPALVLGSGIARPVAETEIERIERPSWPNESQLMQWAHDMAYTQWTAREFRSGEAWQDLRARILELTPTLRG
jgi:hypothetical protein